MPKVEQDFTQISEKELCRQDFIAYCIAQYPSFKFPKHIMKIGMYLEKVANGEINRLIIMAPPRHGKLLCHKTDVLTPQGWKKHGDLVVGDLVFNRYGKPTKILAISEENEASIEITFTDGASIKCHPNHEWVIFDRIGHRSIEKIVETKYMLGEELWIGPKGRGGRARFQVDENKLISFPENDNLIIPPYILGVWLGDGSTTKNCITHTYDDSNIVEKFENLGYKRTSLCIHKDTLVHTSYFKKLYANLKKENLLGFKKIPFKYIFSSIEQRLELLAGLIDSDGYVNPDTSRVTFSNTDVQLIDKVSELVKSLGWRVCITTYNPILSSSGIQGKKVVYQLTFNPTLPIPTVLKRKKIQHLNPLSRKRGIISIKKVTPSVGRCITVDGGVYLVGKNLIPTHNSEEVSKLFPPWYIGKSNGKKTVAVATYGQDLSNEIGITLNNRMNSDVYAEIFPESKPSDSANAIKRLVTINGGGYICTAVGGALTGKGADLRILDDPNKNREEADSDLEQKKQWDWWTSVFYTRGENDIAEDGQSAGLDDSPIVIILTRWSDKDIVKKLLDLQKEQEEAGIPGDKWTILNLEAICESKNDILKREVAPDINDPSTWEDKHALWPEKVSAAMLAKIRYAIGPRDFNSLYQQHPSDVQGELFKREKWGFYSELPLGCNPPVASWDCNYKETSGSDFAVGLIANVRAKAAIYLRKRYKGRWSFPVLLEKVRQSKKDFPDLTSIYIEQKANGQPVIDTLSLEIPGIIAVEPRLLGSKDSRHQAAAKYQNSGCFYLPLNESWSMDFIEDLSPIGAGAKYDDDADSLAQLVLMEFGQPTFDALIKHTENLLKEMKIDLSQINQNDPYTIVYGVNQ